MNAPNHQQRFAYIWRYEIDPLHRSAFVKAYHSAGEWVQLFSRDPAYIKTVFLQDIEDKNQYVTIDFWKSRADRDAFRKRYSDEFERLDVRCEALTKAEHFIGDYLEVFPTSD